MLHLIFIFSVKVTHTVQKLFLSAREEREID